MLHFRDLSTTHPEGIHQKSPQIWDFDCRSVSARCHAEGIRESKTVSMMMILLLFLLSHAENLMVNPNYFADDRSHSWIFSSGLRVFPIFPNHCEDSWKCHFWAFLPGDART
jgi:hypothetical protein